MHWLEGRRERVGVRAALISEVVALAEVIRSRRYCEELAESAQTLRMRAHASTPFSAAEPESFQVSIPEQYNLIYRENATRLGCLDPAEAVDVVRFYQLVLAVVADMSEGGSLYEGTAAAANFVENRNMLLAALEIADRLAGGGRGRVDQKTG